MDHRALVPFVLLLVGGLALAAVLGWLREHGWAGLRVDLSKDRVRRGVGHGLLGLQEFVEPSVEHIFETENREEKDRDEADSPDGEDREQILTDLAASLALDPIDLEEVRRHLTLALCAGLDWREAFESAAEAELRARPYRRPSMPPVWKVAPRE